MTEVFVRRLALALFGCEIVLTCWAVTLGQSLTRARPLGVTHGYKMDISYWLLMSVIASVALFLIWAKPLNRVGWFLSLTALLGIVCDWGQLYGAHALTVPGSPLPLGSLILAWSAPLWVPALLTPATLLLARYPSGSLQPGRALLVDRVIRVAMVVLWLGYATADAATTDEVKGVLPPVQLPGVLSAVLFPAGGIVLLLGVGIVLIMTVRRMLKTVGQERPQIAWLLITSSATVALVFLGPVEWLGAVTFSLLPIGIAYGVLRHNLLGIEVVVRRTLLYGLLTGAVLVVFILITSGLATLLPRGIAPQVVAAVVVAVLLAPARDRLQELVDRFVYGDRDDPWRALGRLGKEAVGAAALQDVVAGVAASLRVPGVQVRGADGSLAIYGVVAGPAATTITLRLGDVEVGELVVSPRRGERALTVADERLLEAIAPMLALVLRSTSLTEALRVEQERVVQATQSERARLRRDLHDGLGPSLTGVGLGLEAVDTDAVPERQRTVVRRLRAEVSASLEEVRRIIDDLQPGALETSDLLTLVRSRAAHLTASTPVRVTVQAPPSLLLSPEVEAAALRIVEEALNNVVRHAQATACVVRIDDTEGLRVEVTDDGVGFAGPREGGVGLASMRSRAVALGGSLELTAAARGTVLIATIPA
ncbi:MAG: sensor histidine kinase [Mycobacteriales bacterium]